MPRSLPLLAAAVVAVSITAAACTGDEAASAPPEPVDPDGPLGAPTTVTLDEDESFVSVSPSGAYVFTVAQPNPAVVADLCIRFGSEYEHKWCVELDDGGAGTWSPTWTGDESKVAFVRAGSRRAGESNDVVRVFDLDRRTVAPITPTDAWLPGSPAPFWIDADRLGYLWPTAEGTLVRTTNLASGAAATTETIANLGDAELEVVSGGASPLFFGAQGTQHALFRLDGDALTLVHDSGVDSNVRAIAPSLEWAVVSMFDVHGSPPPQLVALADGSERLLEPASDDGYVDDAAFSLDSTLVATVVTGGDTTGIELRRIDDLDLVSSTTFTVPPDTAFSSGLTWTAAGLILPTTTDGHPETLKFFPVAPT